MAQRGRQAALLVVVITLQIVNGAKYSANWASLDTRPLPNWYDDAKFGIFMHWGVYSVPSFGSSEWFWHKWKGTRDFKESEFMRKNYKPTFSYQEFAPMFTCEFFDSEQFSRIVQKSGAKYFVLTSKHHDGYSLWPSKYKFNWNSVDVGPGIDIVAKLSTAIRTKGIHFGLYYSLYEWFNPLYLRDKANLYRSKDYTQSVVHPQLREIVESYKPEIVWSDGDWEATDAYWNSTEFIAWLYNESPVKETVVVNDRWGAGIMCRHGDVFTCGDRFQPVTLQKHKWESCITIDKSSWGFRREATLSDYHTIEELVEILVRTVSCGGNLLLNVGPTHDGRITPIFEERLEQIGKWLSVNGEAIYATRPWNVQREITVPTVWYTSKAKPIYIYPFGNGTIVYGTFLKWPTTPTLYIPSVTATKDTKITLLGYPIALKFNPRPIRGIDIDLQSVNAQLLPATWAWSLKMENVI